MSPTSRSPKEDLLALLERGIDLTVDRRNPDTDLPVRESAVLILFGALDAIPADPVSTQAITVPSGLSSADGISNGEPRVPDDLDLLLLRRADRMRHHPGQIAFPGGGVDPEDSGPVAAALREAQEETGLDPSGVEVLGTLPRIPLPVSNNMVTPVVGWWKRPSEIAAVDTTESAQVFRIPVAEMLDPAARYTGVLQRSRERFASDVFVLSERFGGHTVWGFTGILIARLFDELGWTRPWDTTREMSIMTGTR